MQTIGYAEITQILKSAAQKIRDHHEELSKLDSATGDGDHGMAMLKAVQALEKTVDEAEGEDLKELLHNVGWNVMCIDGGSTGPLFGSLFMGMSEGVADKRDLGPADVAQVFQAGLEKLLKQSKAQPGDKTLVDALQPAVEAMQTPEPGADILALFEKAAEAARRGAEATRDMVAKFGRARNLGDRTLGHLDPGATSVSYLFQGFLEGLK